MIQCGGNTAGGSVSDFVFTVTGSSANENVVYIGGIQGETLQTFADLQVDQNIFLNDGHLYIAGGNPSVRTSNSAQRLDFNTDSTTVEIVTANNTVAEFGASLSSLTGSLHLTSSAEGDANPLLRIGHTNTSENILFVTGSGKVGVGTPDPTHMLHISSSVASEDTNLFIIHGFNNNDPLRIVTGKQDVF